MGPRLGQLAAAGRGEEEIMKKTEKIELIFFLIIGFILLYGGTSYGGLIDVSIGATLLMVVVIKAFTFFTETIIEIYKEWRKR